MFFLVDESTDGSMLPSGMTNELILTRTTPQCALTGIRHCKSLRDGAEFLLLPRRHKEAHQRVSHQLDPEEGWVSG